MAFTPETFVLCSKFNLFKAHANLWVYTTADTLEDCLVENYFRPRENLKNQDSPEVGDVIQLIVEHSKLAYLKIVAKTEKPYNITVARTFLENEATLIAELARKADKETDFATPITEDNLGITQAEQLELEEKIDLAANSGRMITAQGVWYAKMYSATVPPAAEDGVNYADFSQVDQDNNPIIVLYERQNGVWVQTDTVVPPAEYDGYVPVTSKIWDITEQAGQQGGRILWNHVAKTFTPYPTIVSFDSIEITGDSTVDMPVNPTSDNIVNVGYVLDHFQTAGRNVGDVFYTARKDTVLNGAVACDGTTYQTTDYMGTESVGNLLTNGKLPYVSLATYATLLSQNGSVGVFGWDGIGTTAFKVPTLTDIFLETGTSAQLGDFIAAGAPNITGTTGGTVNTVAPTGAFSFGSTTGTAGGGSGQFITNEFSAADSNSIYGNSNTIQPKAVRYRAMIQLTIGVQDQAYTNLASVAFTGEYNDLLNKPTIPAAQVNSDWDANSGVAQILNKPTLGTAAAADTTDFATAAQGAKADSAVQPGDLASVATSGNYNDLSNKPTIPTVYDSTLTIQQNGVTVKTFTANSSSNVTANITVPTDTSELSNGAGFITGITSSNVTSALGYTPVNPSSLATVATSGSYNDLSNKPTIPTVNNPTITFTQGGVTKGSITLNQSSASTIAFDAGGGGSSAPTSIDAEIVGNLTVNANGDVSGFSSVNYLQFPGSLDMTGCSSYEMVFAFTTAAMSTSNYHYILSGTGSNNIKLTVSPMGSLRIFISNGDGQAILSIVGSNLSNNTKYYAKVYYDGTDLSLLLSTDGINYTLDGTRTTAYLPTTTDTYQIGRKGAAGDSVANINIIHLNECYIKKNGILIWQGMDVPGLHQRVPTGHEVIEFQAPTAANNYTWYRKYADGWVEQGRHYTAAVSDTDSATFPVIMADTNYSVQMTVRQSGDWYLGAYNQTTTGVTFRIHNRDAQSGSCLLDWEVKGMAQS